MCLLCTPCTRYDRCEKCDFWDMDCWDAALNFYRRARTAPMRQASSSSSSSESDSSSSSEDSEDGNDSQQAVRRESRRVVFASPDRSRQQLRSVVVANHDRGQKKKQKSSAPSPPSPPRTRSVSKRPVDPSPPPSLRSKGGKKRPTRSSSFPQGEAPAPRRRLTGNDAWLNNVRRSAGLVEQSVDRDRGANLPREGRKQDKEGDRGRRRSPSPDQDVLVIQEENMVIDGEEEGEEGNENSESQEERERQASRRAAKEFRKAKQLIASTLGVNLQRATAESETVAEADIQHREERLGMTLSQATQIKSALKDLNKQVKKKKSGGFVSPNDWTVTGRNFFPSWYETHDNDYSCKKTIPSDELRSWSPAPLSGFPIVLERVATALHYAIAIGGFLMQATATLLKLLSDAQDPSKATTTDFEGMRDLAASSNRAALHSLGQSFLASANMDLYRRDLALKNCPAMPKVPASQLRASPLGSEHVFDPSVAADIFDKHEGAAVNDSHGKESQKKKQPFRGERAGTSGQPARQGNKPAYGKKGSYKRRGGKGKRPNNGGNNGGGPRRGNQPPKPAPPA